MIINVLQQFYTNCCSTFLYISKNVEKIQVIVFGKREERVKDMLKLTLRPGEFLKVGDDVKVIIAGGTAGNIRVLVDAPPSINIARSKALEKHGNLKEGERVSYYRES